MARIRKLLATIGFCACLSGPMMAQTSAPAGTGSYFQTLVREAKAHIREIGAGELGALQKADPSLVLVDVREDNEWEKSRIPGAVHVARGVLESRIEARVQQKSTPIVVYCHSGARSAVAADVLGKMGYTKVVSLGGGIAAYQAAGLPVDNSSIAK
jgi:sulfur-carrier protein adenylyltransferase/sulfurtransferase